MRKLLIDAQPEPEKVAFTVTASAKALSPLVTALGEAFDADASILTLNIGGGKAGEFLVREYETSIPSDETEPAFLCLRLDVIEGAGE